MKRANQIAALVLVLAGLILLQEAGRYKFLIPGQGSGPGFLTVLTAGAIVVLAIGIFVKATLSEARPLPPEFIPRGMGIIRLVGAVLLITLLILLIDTLGFRITLAVYMACMILLFENARRPLVAVAIAVPASIGLFWLFVDQLGVSLPIGVFGF